MGLRSGGLIIGRVFASEIWGPYFQKGLFLGGLIIRILQYVITFKNAVVVYGYMFRCLRGISLTLILSTEIPEKQIQSQNFHASSFASVN